MRSPVGAFTSAVVLSVLLLATSSVMVSAHNRFGDRLPPMFDRLDVHADHYRRVEAVFGKTAHQLANSPVEPHASRRRAISTGAMSCQECVDLVTVLQHVAEESKEQLNATKAAAGEACQLAAGGNATKAAACTSIADVVIDLLPIINHGLTSLGWHIPITVCSNLVMVCTQPCCKEPFAPEQMHLGFAGRDSAVSATQGAISVAWVTLQQPQAPFAEFRAVAVNGTTGAWRRASSVQSATYTDGGWVGRVHSATMDQLVADTWYEYRVGAVEGNSSILTFRTLPLNVGTGERPLRILSVADMGTVNSNDTIQRMAAMIDTVDGIDLVLHYGDIGYADADEPKWDLFFNMMQPIVSRVPYMVVPGNHEFYWNFTAYRVRFAAMPTAESPGEGALYYDFNVGPVAFVMIDSESHIDTPEVSTMQASWAESRLAAAQSAKRLAMVTHHRPLYCSADMHLDCGLWADLLRDRLENTYTKYNVAMVQNGHIHNYQRTWPVSAGGWAMTTNLTNPPYPMYLVNGAGGNREGLTGFERDTPAWSAARERTQGFTYMEITVSANSVATINSRFVAASNGTTLDSFTLTKRVG